jgi:hypothetical protein
VEVSYCATFEYSKYEGHARRSNTGSSRGCVVSLADAAPANREAAARKLEAFTSDSNITWAWELDIVRFAVERANQ